MCINVSLITNFLQDYFFVDGSENKMPLRAGRRRGVYDPDNIVLIAGSFPDAGAGCSQLRCRGRAPTGPSDGARPHTRFTC